MAYQPGNAADFTTLFERNQARLVGALGKRLGDPQMAQDSAADAWLKAWQHWPDWKPTGSAEGWVFKIAVNASLDRLRRQRLREPAETVRRLGIPTSIDPEELAVSRQTWLAISKLPLKLSQAFLLHYHCGYSRAEVAGLLHVPVGTVGSRLHRAKRLLRKELARE